MRRIKVLSSSPHAVRSNFVELSTPFLDGVDLVGCMRGARHVFNKSVRPPEIRLPFIIHFAAWCVCNPTTFGLSAALFGQVS